MQYRQRTVLCKKFCRCNSCPEIYDCRGSICCREVRKVEILEEVLAHEKKKRNIHCQCVLVIVCYQTMPINKQVVLLSSKCVVCMLLVKTNSGCIVECLGLKPNW